MLNWKKWMTAGVLALLFGVLVIYDAVTASLAITTLAGVLLLIAGLSQIFAAFDEPRGGERALSLVLGILASVLGVAFVADPESGVISLALVVVVLFAIGGAARLVWAWILRGTPVFWPMLASGAVELLLAGYVVANFAVAGPRLIGILFGVELLVTGLVLIALANFIRSATGAGRR